MESTKLQWITKKVRVCDLIQLSINPRKITEEKKQKLLRSINKFNLVEIPAVNLDMTIIGGNQRVSILSDAGLGDELIDVRFPNRLLTESEVKEYAIISNTHAGEFDFEQLELNFSDINIDDIGFDLSGYESFLSVKKQKSIDEIDEDDYDYNVEETSTNIKNGDIIHIGEHILMCGDSTDSHNWEKILNGEMADLIVTDPPYNVNYEGKTKDKLKIKNDKMDADSFYNFLLNFFNAIYPVTKNGGVWYIWHADSEGLNFRKAMEDSGVKVRQCLIWLKNSMVMGRQDYHWRHEPCLYGWKDGGAHYWGSDRKQTTILEFDRPQRNSEHPTMKPVKLISYQINNSSKVGDIVVDGFGGSGTTMLACHYTERKCRMIEIDPKYCQVIVDRMLNIDPSLKIYKNESLWNPKNS